MNETNLMSKMKISKAVATMAIPSVISSLVTVVYNMADTFFVGQTGDPLQVAAVSLTNPIFILFYGICQYVWNGRKCDSIHCYGWKMKTYEKCISIYHICIFDHRNIFAVILLLGAKPILQILELINRHMILHMDIYFIFLMEHHLSSGPQQVLL